MEENTVKKNKKNLVIGGVVIAALVIFGISSYVSSKAFETTDMLNLMAISSL